MSMIQNVNSGLPEVAEAWALSPLIPLAISLERIAAMVLQLAVTVLILQVLMRKKWTWLLAAIGLELIVSGLLIGLSEAGLSPGWIILASTVWMFGNIYLLFRLGGFDLKIPIEEQESDPDPEWIEPDELL
jgi:uncharacterized membrane protein YhfC